MAGLKIVLPSRFTGTNLPVLKDDPILSAGSLHLVDPTHPVSPWASGVPAGSMAVPNIAATELGALRGLASTSDSVKARYVAGSAWVDTTHGKMERSGKGGLHGMPIQGASFAGEAFRSVDLSPAAMAHVLANQGHSYYFSQWVRITRVEGTGYPIYGLIGHNAESAGPRLFSWQQSERPYSSEAEFLGATNGGYNLSTGPKFRNIAVNGAKGALTNEGLLGRFGWGRLVPNTTPAAQFASYVIYRQYLEDLTVSKRTYAEVSALDNTLYTKEVLTAGGRYYGDTFTTPAI